MSSTRPEAGAKGVALLKINKCSPRRLLGEMSLIGAVESRSAQVSEYLRAVAMS
jgi:hypothetical protein